MMIKAIVTDLDGTFFLHTDGTITVSPSTLAAYNNATRSLGIRVHFATGRALTTAKKGFDEAGILSHVSLFPGVYSDGRAVYGFEGDLIFEHLMERSLANNLITYLHMFCGPHLALSYALRSGHTAVSLPDSITSYLRQFNEMVEIRPLRDDDAIYGINLCCPNGDVDIQASEILKLMPSNIIKGIEYHRDTPMFGHFVAKGAGKATGVIKLCEYMGYKPDEVIVIGDGINDLEMLAAFPNSIAMGNAIDAVKSAARYVTEAVFKDGWALALQRLLPALIETATTELEEETDEGVSSLLETTGEAS